MVSTECAARGNTISLTSPVSEVLTTDGCRLGDETWPFPGPFPTGLANEADLELATGDDACIP